VPISLTTPIDRRSFLAWASLLLTACSSDDWSGPLLPPPPAPLARGPQLAQVTPTSALVAWRSISPVPGALEYGAAAEVSSPVATTEHVFRLTGLSPGTTYPYRLKLDGEVVGADHLLETADPAAPLRFVAFGDSGLPTWDQLDVAHQVAGAAPDLVLHTGDVVYESGAPWELDRAYFLPYAQLIDRIPFYPCLGNHDVRTENGRPLLDALYLPPDERFYSFDRGEVHFVALDSNEDLAPGSVRLTWLADDLAQTRARWIVVYFHHAVYSSSRHGSHLALRAQLAPLFDLHHVDLVLTGHDYERTLPLLGDTVVDSAQEPDYVSPAGTVYVVTGAGGKSLYESGTSAFTAYSESAFHHVQVDLQGPTLVLTAVRSDGTVMDRMTITK
jgi:hypothetical protein